MTTDTRGPLAQRVGALRFQQYLGFITGAFGLLYALQTLDALIADWPTMAGTFGGASVALVAGSVLLGTVAGFVPGRARSLFLGASILFVAAVLVWPLSISGPVPSAPMPWFMGMLPVQAAYLAVSFRHAAAPIGCALLLTAAIAAVLVGPGGLDVLDAFADALFGAAISVVLIVLIAGVRRGVERADAAQQTALSSYGRSRIDDSTEFERARTDALVHDSVLTTFLAAAVARDPESEELARRMALNSLRVLGHVTRTVSSGPAIPFGHALGDAVDRFDPLLLGWDVDEVGLTDLVLPVDVAEVIVSSMLHLISCSVLHADGATYRGIRMSDLGPDGIRIVISDDGRPCRAGDVQDARTAPYRTVMELMRSIDGRADVRSSPETGTTVSLSWGSVVVSGTAPRPAPAEVSA
jgi:hypothetical protein